MDKELAKKETQREQAAKEKKRTGPKPDKIRFKCSCGKVLAAPPERAGAKARCPQCKKVVVVPTPELEEEAQDDRQFSDLFGYEKPMESAHQTCDHCGSKMAPGSVFCVDCGINRHTGTQLTTVTGLHAEIPTENASLKDKLAFWKKKGEKPTYKTISQDRGMPADGESSDIPGKAPKGEKKPPDAAGKPTDE